MDELDDWGRQVINRFVRCGAFSEPKSLKVAHGLFLRRAAVEHFEAQPWDLRCNALAVWALICLELKPPVAEQEQLLRAIVVAQENLPSGRHSSWLVNFVFELFACEFPGDAPSNPSVLPISSLDWTVQDNLFEIIKEAFAENLVQLPRSRQLPNPVEWLTGGIVTSVFGQPIRLDQHTLPETKKSLERSWTIHGVSEALVLLVILGMGPKSLSRQWLKDAEQNSSIRISLVASFLLGLMESGIQPSGRFHRVNITLDQGEVDWSFLSSVALKAEVLSAQGQMRDFLWGYGNRIANHEYAYKRQRQWPVSAGHVENQRELLVFQDDRARDLHERVTHSPDFYDDRELEDVFKGLRRESGFLIEVFLKWCLVEWPVDETQLSSLDRSGFHNIKTWGDTDVCRFIGPLFREGRQRFGVRRLLEAAGQNPNLSNYGKPLSKVFFVWGEGQRSPPDEMWDVYATFPTLLVANAVAAAGNADHVFRQVSGGLLLEASGAFGGVNLERRPNAHWYRQPARREDALLWSWAARQTVDRLMDGLSTPSGKP